MVFFTPKDILLQIALKTCTVYQPGDDDCHAQRHTGVEQGQLQTEGTQNSVMMMGLTSGEVNSSVMVGPKPAPLLSNPRVNGTVEQLQKGVAEPIRAPIR